MKRILTVCAAGLIAGCSVTPFLMTGLHASAYELPAGTVEISSSSMLAYLGGTISGQYLKSDLTYGSCDFTYLTSTLIVDGQGISGDLVGRTVLIYQSSFYSNLEDLNSTWALSYSGILDSYLNFSNVSYFDSGFIVDVGNSSNMTIQDFTIGTLRQTNYFDYNAGNTYDVSYIEENTSSGGAALANVQYSTFSNRYFSSFHLQLDSSDIGSSGIVNIGSLTFSNERGGSVATNRLQIGIVCPIINSDYVWEGSNPPNPPSQGDSVGVTGELTGDVTGTVGTDPVNMDINVDVNIDVPDYNSKLDDINSALNPSYDSSAVDDMQLAGSDYLSAEDSLMSDVDLDSNVGALDSAQDDYIFDDGLIDDSEDFSPLWDINLIGIMIFWVISISTISFVIFGKW